MKSKFLSFLFISIFIPHLVSAAWWDPFTWKIFSKFETKNKPSITATTTLGENEDKTVTSKVITVEELSRKIDELERQLKEKEKTDSTIQKTVKVASIQNSTSSQNLSAKDIAVKVRPSIVFIKTEDKEGSGSIIDERGYVLTNAHVVSGQEGVSVFLIGGIEKHASLIGIDESHDLAILKISGNQYPFVNIDYRSDGQQGDEVFVLGYPLGFMGETGSVSLIDGIISRIFKNYIETTTEFKPGNSGGALVNLKGELIGIPSQGYCESQRGVLTNCLKYSINITDVKGQIEKLMNGMRLYANHQSNESELVIKKYLTGVHDRLNESVELDRAIGDSRDSNLFDYYHTQLSTKQDRSLTKSYVNKLLSASDLIVAALEFLRNQTVSANKFIEDKNSLSLVLDPYQKSTLENIKEINNQKTKDYTQKISEWSSGKKEFDSLLNKPDLITSEYLFQHDDSLKSIIEFLKKEKAILMNLYSGENVAIF